MKRKQLAIAFADEMPTFASNGKGVATRQRSIDFFQLLIDFPNPDHILKKLNKSIEEYKKLASDAQVSACIDQYKANILRYKWRIVGEDARRVQFLEDVYSGMDRGKNSLFQLFQQELDAYFYGYSVFEIIWAKDSTGVVPGTIRALSPHWFKFDPDLVEGFATHEDHNLRFLTTANLLRGELLPEKKFLIASHNASYDDPYGEAKLSTAYWPKIFKGTDLKYWIKFMEKFSIPWVKGKYGLGATADNIQDLADALENAIQDGVIVIPEDSEAELMAPSDGKGTTFKDHLDAMNSEIKRGLLGHDMSGENRNTGTFAQSKVGENREGVLAESGKRIIETVHNELNEWLIDFNFGDGEVPELQLYEPEDEFDRNRVERDKVIVESLGFEFTPEYMKDVYGLDDNYIQPKAVNPVPFPQAFAELSPEDRIEAEQGAVDALSAAVTGKQIGETLVKPILKFAEQVAAAGGDYEQFSEGLPALFPKIDASFLEFMLANLGLSAETWGRVNADS